MVHNTRQKYDGKQPSSSSSSSSSKKQNTTNIILIILSLISLMSRIIYCTYASWLVFTTIDCVPCYNSSSNYTQQLFTSQHSSLSFKTIRDFNIKSIQSLPQNRVKRSNANDNYSKFFSSEKSSKEDYNEAKGNHSKLFSSEEDYNEAKGNHSKLFSSEEDYNEAKGNHSKLFSSEEDYNEAKGNHSKFFSSEEDYYETKRKAAQLAKEVFHKISLDWSVKGEKTEQGTTTKLDGIIVDVSNNSLFDTFLQNNKSQNDSYFSGHQSQGGDEDYRQKEDSINSIIDIEESKAEQNQSYIWPETHDFNSGEQNYEKENKTENIVNMDQEKNSNKIPFFDDYDNYNSLSNSSVVESQGLQNYSEDAMSADVDNMTMTTLLNEQKLNQSGDSLKSSDSKRLQNSSDSKRLQKSFGSKGLQKGLNNYQLKNDSSKNMTNEVEKCSKECSKFLSMELDDPRIRKWAMILITSVLYLYALVMFCIFIGACFSLMDMLIIATLIEGAKLFAAFLLIIIDSFNGKQVHFNLINIKLNVNTKGNGWTADLTYSEYLLDITIFILSTLLCVRVFKCFKKKCKRVTSIEELQSKGIYRGRISSSTSRNFSH